MDLVRPPKLLTAPCGELDRAFGRNVAIHAVSWNSDRRR
jgi:hypothetical protein